MKKQLISTLLILTLLCGTFSLTACGKKPTDVVFTVGDFEMTREEFLYHVAYFEICGINEAAGLGMSGSEFWDSLNDEGITNRQYYYTMTFAEASYYAIMAGVAETVGNTTLSQTETEAADNYAAEYFDLFSENEIERSGMTLNGFKLAIRRIVLANKYIGILKEGFDVDETVIRDSLDNSGKDYSCTGTEWIRVEKTAENALDAITQAYDRLQTGCSVEDCASMLSNVADFTTGSIHINAGSSVNEDYLSAVKDVEEGKTSGIIEGSSVYYVIKVVDKNCDSYYEDTVAQIVDDKIEQALDNYYEQIVYTYTRTIKDTVLKVEEFGNYCNDDQ